MDGHNDGHIDNQEHSGLSHSPPGRFLCCSLWQQKQRLRNSSGKLNVIFIIVNPNYWTMCEI